MIDGDTSDLVATRPPNHRPSTPSRKPGRRWKNRDERLRYLFQQAISDETFTAIVERLAEDAKNGDHLARREIFDRLMGPVPKSLPAAVADALIDEGLGADELIIRCRTLRDEVLVKRVENTAEAGRLVDASP